MGSATVGIVALIRPAWDLTDLIPRSVPRLVRLGSVCGGSVPGNEGSRNAQAMIAAAQKYQRNGVGVSEANPNKNSRRECPPSRHGETAKDVSQSLALSFLDFHLHVVPTEKAGRKDAFIRFLPANASAPGCRANRIAYGFPKVFRRSAHRRTGAIPDPGFPKRERRKGT